MKHKSKAHLSKQLATKRDVQRARDEILSAIVHGGRRVCLKCGYEQPESGSQHAPDCPDRPVFDVFKLGPDRIERAVNG